MLKIILIALSVLALLYINVWGVIYMLGARKRSWIMATVRIGITIVSTVVSIPLAKLLASPLSKLVYSLLLEKTEGELDTFMARVPAMGEGLRVIVALVLAPILFVIVFLVIRFVIAMVMWIVEKKVPVLKERSKLGLTMPLGALNGFLIGAVTLIPLCGFMAFGAKLLYTVEDTGMMESAMMEEMVEDTGWDEDALVEVADTLDGQILMKSIHVTIGKPVFKGLTTAKLDKDVTHGEKVKINLEKEFCGFVTTAGCFSEAVDTFSKEDFVEEDKEILFDAANSMFESDWVALMMTDTLVAMSETWLENESFIGMERPSLDATMNPTVNCVLEIMSEQEPETLREDMLIILDVIGDLMVYDILTDEMGYETLVQRLGQDSLLSSLLSKLEESPRLEALSVELKNLSIRLVTNMLGKELLESGEYDEMIGSVATSLTNVLELPKKERDAVIIESVRENFSAEGYDVPDDVVLEMSNKMIDELGKDGVITADELKTYMVEHAEEGFEITDDMIPDEGFDIGEMQ